ncbi:MAG: type IV pilus biogenesis/stability protein PilW [Gammaproteobacteria bacterium]|nr:type IV pilus biogenesis/stability protein PilW [Gammaproteobacteria bacterium]
MMSRCKIIFVMIAVCTITACVTTSDTRRDTSSPEEAARVNFQLGVEYFRKGKLSLAHEKLTRSVSQDSSQAQPHAFLALVSEQLNLMEDAQHHYRTALRINASDPAVQNMYGAFLCRAGNSREAEDYFLRAANNRFYSTPEAAFTNAGSCALKVDDAVKAEGYLRKALQLNPQYPLALWHMANLNYQQNRDLQARAFLNRIGTAEALPPEALLLGYRIASRSGDARDASRYSEELKQRYPESPETTALLEVEKDGR